MSKCIEDIERVEEEDMIEKISIKDQLKYKLSEIWDSNKDKVILGGIIGGCLLTEVLVFARSIKNQKIFNSEVKAKYGPNTTHGNIFGGSIKKRRADLEAWEKGSRKEDFDRVMKVAKTLHIGSDDVYTIEGFKNPDDEHIAVAVFQQCGQMFHSDWI